MAAEVPVWVKPPVPDPAAPQTAEMLAAGVTNLWLDEQVFATVDPLQTVQAFAGLVHESVEV